MNLARFLIPVCWTLWGALVLGLLWGFVGRLSERSHGPEVSRDLGVVVVAFLLVIAAGAGVRLFWATRRCSSVEMAILTLLLAYPVVVLLAAPGVRAWKTWRFESELARVGDFSDAAAGDLAECIETRDIVGLRRLLGKGPPPTVRDRAGNDLLALSALVVRDREGSPEIVRVLSESGADPRDSRTAEGEGPLHFMVRDLEPRSIEGVRLLLERGADPNAEDPQSGTTPMAEAGAEPELVRLLVEAGADIDQTLPGGESMLVRYIASMQWDSALYLIERGAKLDVTNPDGLSVDYYLQSFRDSVYGEHPDGWDRVRAAIQARRR